MTYQDPNPAPEPDWAGITQYVRDLARQRFPQVIWAIEHPELGPLLMRAAAEGWDGPRLQGELLKTQYYRTTDEKARTWDRVVNEDPATAAKMHGDAITVVNQIARRIGVQAPDMAAWQAGWVLAANVARYGWDEARISSELLRNVQFDSTVSTDGALGVAMDRVKAVAANFLVPYSDSAAFEMGRRMLMNEMDSATVEAYFRDQAVTRFQNNTQVVNMLNRGFNATQIFAPMVQQTAQLLEIAPEQVDLMDSRYAAMIDHVDESGAVRPMTLSESARHVRNMDEWQYTRGARGEAAAFAEFLGQRMGSVA